jgi:uroporphyrinogen-III synthase
LPPDPTKILVTRPEPDLWATIARLEAIGLAGIGLPLLERATLHTSLPDARGFSALALTSVNALRALAERDALKAYHGVKVFAVGDRTAEAARAMGFADVLSGGGTFSHLVEAIAAAGLRGPVFYPAARHQAGDLAKELAPFGLMVVTARVYEMRAVTALPDDIATNLAAGSFAAALFYSRRTAETFAELAHGLDRATRARLGVLCLSEQVAEPLMAAHFVRIGLAEQPSEEAMMALALSFASDRNAS